nr:hypothetical protein [Candidatus Sigynarchaeota archaeon]
MGRLLWGRVLWAEEETAADGEAVTVYEGCGVTGQEEDGTSDIFGSAVAAERGFIYHCGAAFRGRELFVEAGQ